MLVRIVTAGLLIGGTTAVATAPPSDHFFPSRPANAIVHTLKGVLAGYGHGEATGGIQVRDAAGTVHAFYMGYPMKINGTAVVCFSPPQGHDQGLQCPDWPPGLVIGVTPVTLYYWDATLGGQTVEASDELEFTPPSRRRSHV